MSDDFGAALRALGAATDSLAHSIVRNYVTPGLTSALVGGAGHGCVRLLESDRDTREWITPHSHRFDFTCIVLAGQVENIEFTPSSRGDLYACGTLRPIDGGLGQYEVVHGEIGETYAETTRIYGPGGTYSMRHHEIHSIRFSRGARVLFFEGPNVSDTSVFLEPYSNGATVHTFAVQPWMFQKYPGSLPKKGP